MKSKKRLDGRKGKRKNKQQTEWLMQQNRENCSCCVIVHIRPLQLKHGKTNGISSFELILLIFRFMWNIISLFRCCCVKSSSKRDFHFASVLLGFFYHLFKNLHILAKVHLVYVFVQRNRNINEYKRKSVFMLWIHCYRLRKSAQPEDAD